VASPTTQPPLVSTIHVLPSPTGRWIIRREDDRQPLSEHDTASEAEQVARQRAAGEAGSRILLHDRYARVRRLT
jgi:hypothetical protein